jgi:hypothetical protein
MKWTKDVPTREGHYWVVTKRSANHPSITECVEVFYYFGGDLPGGFSVYRSEHSSDDVTNPCFLRWYGPLSPPPFDDNE